MGTITAQILVGNEHPYHGGIEPIHYMFLSENSRPAWMLVEQNIYPSQQRFPKITWIPTKEHMLEDALLMIAIHLIKNQELTDMITEEFPNLLSERVEYYNAVNEDKRSQLQKMCRTIPSWPKLCISVFQGSSIQNELNVLKNYSVKTEICLSSDINKNPDV